MYGFNFELDDFQKEAINYITEHTPEKYADYYPLARNMHRKFILHIGPTNSGKTYGAVKALEEADSGIYLGPLRLLAYEEYERLTNDGFACSIASVIFCAAIFSRRRSELDAFGKGITPSLRQNAKHTCTGVIWYFSASS